MSKLSRRIAARLPAPARCFCRSSTGSVSVELALVSIGFLVPLFIGSADFIYVMTCRAQLAAAMQNVEIFAWSHPSDASNQSAINKTLAAGANNDLEKISQVAPATMSYTCLQSDGTTSPASITYNSGYNASSLSTASASSGLANDPVPSTSEKIGTVGTASCSSGFVQANASYHLATTVNLPVNLPGVGSSLTLDVNGKIWVH